jgi:hypothetical protein
MTTFTAKARQLIDDAVTLLPPPQTLAWAAWAAAHPDIRLAGGTATGGTERLPREMADIVLAALAAKAVEMRRMIAEPGLSEDAISDLDNDLSHLRAVERGVRLGLANNRSAA